MVMKKTKTITRYDNVSKRPCPPKVLILSLSYQRFCNLPCPPITQNTLLDGGQPNTTSTCIISGGDPGTGGDIFDGGNPANIQCTPITSNQVLDGNRSDTYCAIDGGNPTSQGGNIFDGGNL
jgi:hypothetical protein